MKKPQRAIGPNRRRIRALKKEDFSMGPSWG
jgi:hypothetical protein